MKNEPNIRILVFKDGDMYVAQCLEFDIAACADTLDQLRGDIVGTIDAYRSESLALHGAAFQGIGPAPAEFHDMWDEKNKFEHGANDFDMALAA